MAPLISVPSMRIALGLAVIGVGLALVAAIGFLSAPADVGDPGALASKPPADSTTSTTSPPAPPETPIEPAPLWLPNVSSQLGGDTAPQRTVPVRLEIDALEIDAPVGAYGVDRDGRMDVPDNITEVGWYKFGPAPGDPGSAVLAAHVDLAGPGRGLFYDLDQLEVGDVVTVGYSDDTEVAFEVVARSTYLKTELPLNDVFREGGAPTLTLVTCGGGFSRSRRSYDSNVVVYAVPVDQSTEALPAA